MTALVRDAVAVCALVAGCASWQEPAFDVQKNPAARTEPDDRDLAALVPAGAETVIEVDLAALRRSAWTAAALVNPDVRLRDRKVAALGYDDVEDIDRIIYAVGHAGGDAPTLVIAQGRIQAAVVEAAFRQRWPDATTDTWRGLPLHASGENALAAISPRTFVSGAPVDTRAAIDRAFGSGADFRDGGTASGEAAGLGAVRRDLMGVADMTPPAVLATLAVSARVRARVGDAFPLPRELWRLGVRLDVGESLDLRALGVLRDRGAAQDLARRLGILLRDRDTRQVLDGLGLAELLDGAKVTAEGAEVRLRVSVGAEHRAHVSAALRTIVAALRGGGDPRARGSW